VCGKTMIVVISILLPRFVLLGTLGITGRNIDMFQLRHLRNGRNKFLKDWSIFIHMIPVLSTEILIAVISLLMGTLARLVCWFLIRLSKMILNESGLNIK
jgi:hypothetical protein